MIERETIDAAYSLQLTVSYVCNHKTRRLNVEVEGLITTLDEAVITGTWHTMQPSLEDCPMKQSA